MPSKTRPTNRFAGPICLEHLVALGFTLCRHETKPDGKGRQVVTACGQVLTNAHPVVDDHYFYAPLEVVMTRVKEGREAGWYLAMDTEFDHVWQGKMETMPDLLCVLAGLSR